VSQKTNVQRLRKLFSPGLGLFNLRTHALAVPLGIGNAVKRRGIGDFQQKVFVHDIVPTLKNGVAGRKFIFAVIFGDVVIFGQFMDMRYGGNDILFLYLVLGGGQAEHITVIAESFVIIIVIAFV